ncbi:MAG: hypothetical protein GX222_08910 [Ruminococcaceae bacterium]|nr:hypothetical protein [Oscillospiraceae bacterium]
MTRRKEESRTIKDTDIQEKYEVVISFTDPEDKDAPEGANIYWAGKNLYPRDGYKPTAKRIAFLLSNKTSFKKPVISKR